MAETLNISNPSYFYPLKKSQRISLVLIHGWGVNSGVWQIFLESLPHDFTNVFNVLTVDLPGFGAQKDATISPYSLTNICQKIAFDIPQPAIYLGWSLGGLVATEMALNYPEQVLGLVTVASSPYFIEKKQSATGDDVVWPGVKLNVLHSFHQQLQLDIKKTIMGFLKLQAIGNPNISQDIKKISLLVFQNEMASETTLIQSLKLLETSDYRKKLKDITQPFLRLYGGADSLVPKAVVDEVSKLARNSDSHIFKQASHAPFISHLDDFQKILSSWLITQIKKWDIELN